MRVLIIVDPQNDFITGTLPVEGADVAMNRLADALDQIPFDHLVVTMDAHPIKHCSFKSNGGIWPIHCVKYSIGAALWEPLMQAIIHGHHPTTFVEKGRDTDRDQYSAFETTYPEILNHADEILLAGIAGNVCVLNTLKDLANHQLGDKIKVVTDAAPSLDDGTALKEMIRETKVKETTINRLITERI